MEFFSQSVQSLSPVRLCHPMDFTISQSLLKLTSIELMRPSNHLILHCPLLLWPSIFPSIRVFSNESVLHIKWPSIGVSASAAVLPMNIQGWFPLGCTSWISLQSTGLSGAKERTLYFSCGGSMCFVMQLHRFSTAQLPGALKMWTDCANFKERPGDQASPR